MPIDTTHIITPPESTLGILGAGQLGRMLALAARQMGYRVVVFAPEDNPPAAHVSDTHIQANYTDIAALTRFGQSVDVVTLEFENIPAEVFDVLEPLCPVFPSRQALFITQNRLREKTFLQSNGLPMAPFLPVSSLVDLEAAVTQLGCPAVLKTAGFGYDGKGQYKLSNPAQCPDLWQAISPGEYILEAWVPWVAECSVVAARGQDGTLLSYPITRNHHENHILDYSIVPAGFSPELETQATQMTQTIAAALDYVGTLAVEFFVTADDVLLVNEIAPRPHNSGHWTIDGAVTSQFEQQLRAVCGLPLGSPELIQPTAMANLLGDLWQSETPHWESLLTEPSVKLHLYGKREARPGRKMGHLTTCANSPEDALKTLLSARNQLREVVLS